MRAPATIGYLTSAYARASDSFIRFEVEELRALGHTVHTFSIRRPAESEIVSEDIRRERAGTEYVLLKKNAARLTLASVGAMLRSPIALAQAVRLAYRCATPGVKGKVWSLAYIVESCFLASLLRKYEVEHLHNHIGEGSATVAMLAAHLAGITFSLTIHGPGEFDHPRSLALDEKIRRATFTAAVSDYGRAQLMRWTSPQDWPKLKIVRCGVAAHFLTQSRTSVPPQSRLVFVGRLTVEKGILTLMEAVRALADTEPFFDVVVIGDGPMRPTIEKVIAEYRIGDRVTLRGWMNGEDVRNEILRARALVLPSYAENLPVAIMEALALSRPVISTYIGGIPELVRDGECGWLVPAGSASALTTAMREALRASPDKLERMGKAGAKLVALHHNAKTQAKKLARCLLGDRQGAGEASVCRPESDWSDNSIFVVTPIPTRVIDGEVCLDDQTCGGLARWLQHFDRMDLATVSMPDGLINSSTKWQRVSELPFASRLRITSLPWAYGLKDFLKSYSSARRLMREQIHRAQYLCFVPCGKIGDWGSVAAWEALRAGRRYAVLLDRSEARFMRSSLSSLPTRRRMKETLMLPLVAAYQHVIVRKSAVGLFQGRDCFNAFSSVCDRPFCIYDVHTRKSDQIDEQSCAQKRRDVESRKRLRVCYAGRATEIKGPMDWLRALHAALESGIDLEAVWLGDGPLLTEMAACARELGIEGRVDFAGFVEGAKVLEVLRKSHIFLFCHTTTESPRCLIEALVCGTQLLGYDSVYARDIVAEHGGGVFVPRGQWQQLASALRDLDADREGLSGLIQAASASGRLFDEETLYGRRATLIKDHLGPAVSGAHDQTGSTAA